MKLTNMNTESLQSIFNRIGNLTDTDYGCNDKGGKIHTYLETYEKLFSPFRNGCTFMELGLALGHSVQLFDEYFENSKIIGVDITIVFPEQKYKNDVKIIECDATSNELLGRIGDTMFDIVIDDSSHVTQDQINTFNMLKHRMNPGSIYIIEDLLALDLERHKYLALHPNAEIIDMRSNGRFDNCLCVIKF